jgi:hypothetical protein
MRRLTLKCDRVTLALGGSSKTVHTSCRAGLYKRVVCTLAATALASLQGRRWLALSKRFNLAEPLLKGRNASD